MSHFVWWKNTLSTSMSRISHIDWCKMKKLFTYSDSKRSCSWRWRCVSWISHLTSCLFIRCFVKKSWVYNPHCSNICSHSCYSCASAVRNKRWIKVIQMGLRMTLTGALSVYCCLALWISFCVCKMYEFESLFLSLLPYFLFSSRWGKNDTLAAVYLLFKVSYRRALAVHTLICTFRLWAADQLISLFQGICIIEDAIRISVLN